MTVFFVLALASAGGMAVAGWWFSTVYGAAEDAEATVPDVDTEPWPAPR